MTVVCPSSLASATTPPKIYKNCGALIWARRLGGRRGVALVLVVALGVPSAFAATDWEVASHTWREQLAELYVADAARRFCQIPISNAVASNLRSTIAGLEQALGAGSKSAGAGAERLGERGVVAEAGGRQKFCADASSVDRAKATLQAIIARVMASGGNMASPMQSPQQTSSASSPTPVFDPDVALIRGCRRAVLARRQSKSFWSQYERCVSEQGAGWF
jgi:hypothetical protein